MQEQHAYAPGISLITHSLVHDLAAALVSWTYMYITVYMLAF